MSPGHDGAPTPANAGATNRQNLTPRVRHSSHQEREADPCTGWCKSLTLAELVAFGFALGDSCACVQFTRLVVA